MSHDNNRDHPMESPVEESPASGYGLPTPRDDKNNLLPQDHEFTWNGQDVKIKLVPPTIEQLETYQEFGNDVEVESLREVVDRHVVEPLQSEGLEAADLTVREVNCYVEGIVDYGASGGTNMEEIREAIEEREDLSDEGN